MKRARGCLAGMILCGSVLVISGALAQAPAGGAANPEDGSVGAGVYKNDYFGLAYPLPSGWAEGLKGPSPSPTGYYVLASLEASGEGRPSLLVVAQDMFFDAKPMATAKELAQELREAEARIPNMAIDREPGPTELASHSFMRVDYSAGGLYRAWLATDIRCHVVIFNITTTNSRARDETVLELAKLSLPREASADTVGSGDADSATPICLNDYATGSNVIHRVEPVPADPRFVKMEERV